MVLQLCSAVVPYSYVQYTGTGTTGPFSVPFPYLLQSHVRLYRGLDLLSGTYAQLLTSGTDYTWTSATQVQLTSALASGAVLTIRRETPTNTRLVDWSDGSNLNAADLDCADLQNFYAVQDQQDRNDVVAASEITTAANATAALNAVNAALPYTAIANVATIPAAPANDTRIEIADSTGIQSFSPLTGRPAGLTGASNIVVRLKYSSAGSTWQWVDYRPTDPDARYGSVASVTAAQSTANSATTAAAAAQSTANSASAAASNAQSTANNAGATATTALAAANNAGAAATAAQSTANTANATANGRQQMLLDTAKASTSGNAIDFTGIPSWAKKITVVLQGVSAGTSSYLLRIGSASGGVENTGYISSCTTSSKGTGGSNLTDSAASSTGLLLLDPESTGLYSGSCVLTLVGSNIWTLQGVFGGATVGAAASGRTSVIAGSKTLSAPLDRLQITTVAGNQAFDAGTINVLYEGYA